MTDHSGNQDQNDLASLSIRRPVLVCVVALLIILAGLAAMLGVEIRELPNVDRPTVTISATYRGASPETVDAEVTSVLESAASRVSGVKNINSQSEEGSSRVRIEFYPDVEINDAASDIREAVSRATRSLPDEVEEVRVVKADADASAIMRMAVVTTRLTEEELANIVDDQITPALLAVPGVAEITVNGDREKVLHVRVDPLRIASYGLSVKDIADVLRTAQFDIPAGSFESADQKLFVRADASVWEVEKLNQMLVRDGILLGDVADIYYGPDDATSYVRLDGRAVIGLGVVRQAQSNTIAISNGVREAVDRLNKQFDGIEIFVNSDDAVFIEGALWEVIFSLALAIIIVIGVLYLFLRSFTATLIPTVTIPIALIGTVAAVWAMGFSINILTLLALVLATGMIVDDAIVVLENIQRRRHQGLGSMAAAVLGTRQVFFAVIATTLTLISVFVPISFLPSTAGRLFREFGFVLAFSVAVSSFVALTLCPMLASRLKHIDPHDGDVNVEPNMLERVGIFFAGIYRVILEWVLRNPVVTLMICIVAGGLAFGAYNAVTKELLPNEDRGRILVSLRGPDGVGIDYMDRQVEAVENILRPVVDAGDAYNIYTIVGLWDPNRALVIAPLVPWDERDRSQQEITNSIRGKLNALPGVQAFVWQPNSLGLRGGTGEGLQFALTGTNYRNLAANARALQAELEANNPKLTGIRVSYQTTQPQLLVNIDRKRAFDLGIEIDELDTTLRAMIEGYEVTDINVDDQSIPVKLRSAVGSINDPSDLENLFVTGTNGRILPLSSVITLSEEAVASELEREGQQRAVGISANLAPGYTLDDAVNDVTAAADKVLPPGVGVLFLGDAAALGETSNDVQITFLIAVLVVLLVLAAQFESFMSALVVVLTVPFGLAAAIFALSLSGTSINIYSQIGLVMLVGLMAKNGILVVEFADQLRDAGRSVREAVHDAAMVRLRPIMMTMISTVLGGLPLVLGSGAGAEARAAIGWVVFGGLGFATVFTLFLTPVLYLLLAPLVSARADGSLKLQTQLRAAESIPDTGEIPDELPHGSDAKGGIEGSAK
ncbi:efflux RND transporter permease subunit [Thalassospira profundimaris]|uniref:Multidrug transporter AcrB n=1 Tax=Thalassospira profundimaris TaxID=502049 RepID=A0A367X567_9PROT|nr:efflux RND transporter permease subunit [Thalassospira profundimaris]RCK47901.1 multidrug transporter AcrB [Thalassospira profundimaris]